MSDIYEPKGFAETIFKQRYAIKEDETYLEACQRVAGHVAQAEKQKLLLKKWKRKVFLLSFKAWKVIHQLLTNTS